MLKPAEYLLHDVPSPEELEQMYPPKKTAKGQKSKSHSAASTREDEELEPTGITDPDTCILFRRYTEAGKIINVYDWYQSFVVALEPDKPQDTENTEWEREAYSRFMWALHELDLLGVLRWTGRGAGKKGSETVGKVIWISPDGQ